MCLQCGHNQYEGYAEQTAHLVYWAKEWFKQKEYVKWRLTMWHIVNRKAYNEWKGQQIFDRWMRGIEAWNNAGRP